MAKRDSRTLDADNEMDRDLAQSLEKLVHDVERNDVELAIDTFLRCWC